MEDIDRTFVTGVKAGDIMVADNNFGCGSSREHAPVAIKASGITCVIAANFARIFYRNAINIGLPLLEIGDASAKIKAGDVLSVDLESGEIVNATSGETIKAQPLPGFIQDIAACGGLINYVKGSGKMKKNIAVLPGDGIGPEVTTAALAAMHAAAARTGMECVCASYPVGGAAIDACGVPLPEETAAAARAADAVLFGSIGGPKWDNVAIELRPEKGLLALRKRLGLFANLRPVKVTAAMADLFTVEAGTGQRRRYPGHARTDRRHLFRQALRV